MEGWDNMSITAEQARIQSDHFKDLMQKEFEENNAHLIAAIDDIINEAIKMGEYEAKYSMAELTKYKIQYGSQQK